MRAGFLLRVMFLLAVGLAVTVTNGFAGEDSGQSVPWGAVVLLTRKGPPPRYEKTGIEVIFTDFKFDAVINPEGLTEPRAGQIKDVYIGGKNVPLERHDFKEGFIHTRDFGKIPVFFAKSVYSDGCMLVVSRDQLRKIKSWIAQSSKT